MNKTNVCIIVKDGNTAKAMRLFKDAIRRTRTIERHVDSLTFDKPSVVRRRKKARGRYRQEVRTKIANEN